MDLRARGVRPMDCPYGADKCPKVEETLIVLDDMRKRLLTIERLLYICIGIIAVETGVVVT